MDKGLLTLIERCLVGFLVTIWVIPHLYLAVKGGDFYQTWPEVLEAENDDLTEIANDVTDEQKALKEVVFLTSEQPPPPEVSSLPSVIAAVQVAKRRTTRRYNRALSK